MDGVLRKLQLRERTPVLLLGLPPELRSLAAAIPGQVDRTPNGSYPFVLAFARSLAEADVLAPVLSRSLEDGGVCWVAYPKGTSRRYPNADVNRDTLHARMATHGFDGVSIVALDTDWSALRVKRA